jgi:hypothetical protein
MKFFADEFGFSPNETVALMGAHTLGSAIPHNSGFKARRHPVNFDNDPFILVTSFLFISSMRRE